MEAVPAGAGAIGSAATRTAGGAAAEDGGTASEAGASPTGSAVEDSAASVASVHRSALSPTHSTNLCGGLRRRCYADRQMDHVSRFDVSPGGERATSR